MLAYTHLEHGRAGVKPSDALVREALHRRLVPGQELRDGPPRRRRSHAGQNYFPLRGFQVTEGSAGGAGPGGATPRTPPARGGPPPPPPPPHRRPPRKHHHDRRPAAAAPHPPPPPAAPT